MHFPASARSHCATVPPASKDDRGSVQLDVMMLNIELHSAMRAAETAKAVNGDAGRRFNVGSTPVQRMLGGASTWNAVVLGGAECRWHGGAVKSSRRRRLTCAVLSICSSRSHSSVQEYRSRLRNNC